MTKEVLVTGASGFTGSQLANELARQGNHVRALVRESSNLALLDKALIDGGKIQLVYGDLRSNGDVQQAVSGTSHVYHIAALYRSAKHSDDVYWDVNVGGTERILAAAKASGVERILHCSTIGVHGGVQQIPSNEESPYSPSDIYQVTKLEGEKRAQQAIDQGQPVTIVRPAGIYGPGDLRFLKLFSLVKSGRFIMFGSGKTYLHLVYIDDLVDGMIQAMAPCAVGQTLILAGDEYVSLDELVGLVANATNAAKPKWRLPLWLLMSVSATCEWVCRPFGIEPPLHRRRASFFTKDRAFSIARAQREIGYLPKVDLATGLGRTAAWYASQRLLA